MKKILTIISVIVLIGGGIVIFFLSSPKEDESILSLDTHYVYTDRFSNEIEFSFFTSNFDSPLLEKDLYIVSYLTNNLERYDISIKYISAGHIETYKDKSYLEVIIECSIQGFSSSRVIDDISLVIKLSNDLETSIYLGTFEYIIEKNDKSFELIALEGKKTNDGRTRIDEVIMEVSNLNKTIKEIKCSNLYGSTFFINDNQITIHLVNEAKLLYNFPLIIEFMDSSKQVIENFKYVNDYEMILNNTKCIYNGRVSKIK
jgi:hypothetical protein